MLNRNLVYVIVHWLVASDCFGTFCFLSCSLSRFEPILTSFVCLETVTNYRRRLSAEYTKSDLMRLLIVVTHCRPSKRFPVIDF